MADELGGEPESVYSAQYMLVEVTANGEQGALRCGTELEKGGLSENARGARGYSNIVTQRERLMKHSGCFVPMEGPMAYHVKCVPGERKLMQVNSCTCSPCSTLNATLQVSTVREAAVHTPRMSMFVIIFS